ncbi:MAG: hypothetical protein U9N87_07725, partial [Planctomycetota bacterium]|nr:hypothetical protein [Planctomycetota bacterium]
MCGPAGWTALLLSVGAAAWLEGRLGARQILHVFCALGMGAVILAACALSPRGDWTAFHVLVGGWTAIVLLITGLGIFGQKLRLGGRSIFTTDAVCGWVFAGSSAALVFTLLWCLADPWSPWWPGGVVLALSLAAGAIGAWRRMPAVVYTSGILANVAGTIAWAAWMPRRLETFLEVNALCLAATAVVWTVVDMLLKNRPSVMQTGGVKWPYAQVAIRAALGMLGTLAAVLVYQNVLGMDHPLPNRFTWISLASVAAALVVLVWDRSSWVTLSGMYTLGLVTIALGLVRAELERVDIIWLGMIELGGFVLVAALVGWALPGLWPLWQRLGIHRESRGILLNEWFPVWQLIIAGVAGVGAAWIAIDFRFEEAGHTGLSWMSGRLFAAVAVAALIGTGVLMAQQTQRHWREVWQYVAAAASALLLACLGWALLPIEQAAPWLHRAAVLMIACTATSVAAAGGLRPLLPKSSDWIDAGRRVVAPLAALALVSLAVVLMLEFKLYEKPYGPPTEIWAELSVAGALVALCSGCLCLAVVPRLEPFGLSQRGRTLYVYAAEALLVLLCLHLRLTMPELFDLGIIRRYWMLIVMAVAFCGAGLSEWFQRLRQPVLSEPLANTALVAPILPAVGFWFVPTASPAMWFLMCLFYGMMATIKRSFTFGGLAIVAGNMGLWVLWQRMGLDFFNHPQIWLIPGALAVLAAGHLHRDRLSEAQNVGLRWAALGVVYVSSTADMFIAGIGNSVWLPLVLAV